MSIIKNSLKNNILPIHSSGLLAVFVLIHLNSCGSSIKLKHVELSEISTDTSFYFDNFPYMTNQTNYRFISFLDALAITDTPTGAIYMDFTEDKDLRISYQNQRGKLVSKTYTGTFENNYYQVYFERKNVGLPPLYWETKIDRMQLAINKEGSLVINHKYKHGKYYFFGLIFHNVTDDLLYDQQVSRNQQQLFFRKKNESDMTSEEDFRLFL